MSFFLVLPAQDVSQSTTLGVTFYVIHMFRMSLFFFIAGFFAHLVFHRRGARAFVKDRAKRILVPMTVGWVVLAPPTIAAVIWGLTRTFPDGPPAGVDASARSARVPSDAPLVPLLLEHLLRTGARAARRLRHARRPERRTARAHRQAGRRRARELPRAARARRADLRGALLDRGLAGLVRHPDAGHGLRRRKSRRSSASARHSRSAGSCIGKRTCSTCSRSSGS